MSVSLRPKRPNAKAAEKFIAAADAYREEHANRLKISIRVPIDCIKRVDRAARGMGLTRSAFMVHCTMKAVEKIEAR